MNSLFRTSLAGLALALSTLTASAQTTDTRPVDPQAALREIAQQLAAPDADQAAAAVERADKLLTAEPARAAPSLKVWLKALLDAGHHKLADDFALRLILGNPADTLAVEAAQAARVRAALGQDKPDEALAAAKSLYNVSSMAGTANALLLIAECLNARHPGDVEVVKKFRIEQLNGAKFEPPTSQPANAPEAHTAAHKSPTLSAIKVDPAPYEPAFRKIIGEDYPSLVARGNLLLLADRVADARELFERAYGVGADANVVAATENLARVIKAEDGTIGRANAFVHSLRPGGPAVGKPLRTKGQ